MAIYQIFIKLPNGQTNCLQLPSPSISGETLKFHLATKISLPLHSLRLLTGTREIADQTLISCNADHHYPSCSLLPRLRGGKGGFGSLLRGAATKAGQKKTSNFDACRDMSGRRLRHVNAEKRLEEWKAEAENRKLEKLAEQFLKKKAKEGKKTSEIEVEKYLKKYREDAERCAEKVEESVKESFQLYNKGKRKVLPVSGPDSSKRLKIWLGKKKVEASDSESESESEQDGDEQSNGEDLKSVVLDEGYCSNRSSKSDEGNSSQSEGESSGAKPLESISEESNGESDDRSPAKAQASEGSGDTGTGDSNVESDGILGAEMVGAEMVGPEMVGPTVESGPKDSPDLPNHEQNGPNLEIHSVINHIATSDFLASNLDEPLDLAKYNSAADLEVLGMERLKAELQRNGLKCGGTLQERASRLFLLKTTPVDKLPKKLLAKK